MPYRVIRMLARLALGSAILTLQACSQSPPPFHTQEVAQAYESAGVVTLAPYTRTIFSGTNF